MNKDTVPVTVHILDKEYQIACPPEEHDALLNSARYLNERMREIRDSGKVIGVERVAVMAALNITHELLQSKTCRDSYARSMGGRIKQLQDKIELALAKNKQLEL